MSIAIWLLPEPAAAAALDSAIAEIADDAGKTAFHAHLTLAVGPGKELPDLSELAQRFPPVSLTRDGVLQTDAFTRSFALTFKSGAELMALRAAAERLLGARSDDNFTPHVSLTYGEIGAMRLLEDAEARFSNPIAFDGVCAVAWDGEIATQEDVAAWRVGPTFKLMG